MDSSWNSVSYYLLKPCHILSSFKPSFCRLCTGTSGWNAWALSSSEIPRCILRGHLAPKGSQVQQPRHLSILCLKFYFSNQIQTNSQLLSVSGLQSNKTIWIWFVFYLLLMFILNATAQPLSCLQYNQLLKSEDGMVSRLVSPAPITKVDCF